LHRIALFLLKILTIFWERVTPLPFRPLVQNSGSGTAQNRRVTAMFCARRGE